MCEALIEVDTDLRIVIRDYPELRQIAWNRDPMSVVTGKEALALYEANWRFVDQGRIKPFEQALIDRLVREYGNGVLNV